MDTLIIPLEFRADDSRQSPGRIYGTLLTYETRAKDRAEVFAAGALTWDPAGIVLNEQHNRQAPIMRFVPELRGKDVVIDAPLPDTSRGRDAAVMIANQTFRGLSVEFKSLKEHRAAGVRRITSARLGGAGLVDDPSHVSSVEIRHRDQVEHGGCAGMAVTLTAEQLAAAMRLGDSIEEMNEVVRLIAYASEAVVRHAPACPDVVHNEAAIRLCSYLFDQPTSSRRDAYANAMRNSGAGRMMLGYTVAIALARPKGQRHRSSTTPASDGLAADRDRDGRRYRCIEQWFVHGTCHILRRPLCSGYSVEAPDGTSRPR